MQTFKRSFVRNSIANLALLGVTAFGAATIQIDATAGKIPIHPQIYGKNDFNISDDSTKPTSDSAIQILKDAGIKIVRLTGGNNSTKYNWRARLSSHPDWFNNVYAHNWDFAAQEMQSKLPNVQAIFALQVLGWVASNVNNNWSDYAWGQAHNGTYPSASFDLAGGGTVSTDGKTQLTAGNPQLYLKAWPADSSIAILPHWFGTGTGDLSLNQTQFQYWNMDNEPDIWHGTHNDIVPDTMMADTFINRYITVAKAARIANPNVLLVGPVFANEWQWWVWNKTPVTVNGTQYSSMEYFIKKIGEAEKSTGLKLLDVYDQHFYPGYSSTTTADRDNLLQLHRVLFDTTYAWPKSNGIHTIDNKWTKAVPNYTFLRISRWMEQYLGTGRSRLAMTEFGSVNLQNSNPAAEAVVYASFLGTMADNNFEIFTPWDWQAGWYESLHLFTTYAKANRVSSTSTLDSLVSAYTSVNNAGDSLTVILVNRDANNTQTASVSLAHFIPGGAWAPSFQIANITSETFVSATSNAISKGSVDVANNAFQTTLPKLSVTAFVFSLTAPSGTRPVATLASNSGASSEFSVKYANHTLTLRTPMSQANTAGLFDVNGHQVATWNLAQGTTLFAFPMHAQPGRYYVQVSGLGTLPIMIMQ